MSSILLRSARPAVSRSAALVRMAVVPARRVTSHASQTQQQQQKPQQSEQSQQQQQQQQQQQKAGEPNVWATPASAPLKAAAGEVLSDVAGAAAGLKNGMKAKLENNASMGELREKAAQLGEKAKRAAASVSEQLGDLIDPEGKGKAPKGKAPPTPAPGTTPGAKPTDAGKPTSNSAAKGPASGDKPAAGAAAPQGKRSFHSSSRRHVSRQTEAAVADLKDDAKRLGQKVQNRSTQAGVELKEQGQSLLHSAKKAARSVGAAVSDAVGARSVGAAVSDAVDSVSATANKAIHDASGKAAQAELSTDKARTGNVIGGDGESSLGETQESVKKSLFDGPQTMPQGVGKRAVDAEGKPMETGGPRT